MLDYITKQKETDYINRTEQLRIAYSLIGYTSYFEALQNSMPEDVLEKIRVKLSKNAELQKENSVSFD